MSHPVIAAPDQAVRPPLASVDLIVAAVFLAIFAYVVHAFQYRGALGESDLYRVLVGLMDGAVSGRGLGTDLHYDRAFGFGYLAAFYAFADPSALRDPDRLMALMNQVGFWSMLVGLSLFWCAVGLVHGARVATVALVVFALAPMIPELATSGHQVIPMFAFLCGGAVLAFLPLTGWRAALAGCGTCVLLLAGLTMRGEIFLAFPWLVLARVNTQSIGAFIRSALLRSIAPAAALVAFVLLQHAAVPNEAADTSGDLGSTVIQYFSEFYTWVTILPGMLYMVIGCGFVTVPIALAAGLYLGWRTVLVRRLPPVAGLAEFLGPVALVIVPFAFFVPNPAPTRHFMLTLAGLSILIGLALTRHPALGRVAALAIALAIGAANQVVAELVRPTLLRINEADSPYLPVYTDYPTTTHANLGWAWRRHWALVERRARWQALGEKLRTVCDSRVIVFSEEAEQVFSRLYEGGTPVEARRVQIDIDPEGQTKASTETTSAHMAMVGAGDVRIVGLEGQWDGKTVLVLAKSHAWPMDSVAALLADPAYADYRMIADPYTMSRFDKTPVPADRAPRFGCPDPDGRPRSGSRP